MDDIVATRARQDQHCEGHEIPRAAPQLNRCGTAPEGRARVAERRHEIFWRCMTRPAGDLAAIASEGDPVPDRAFAPVAHVQSSAKNRKDGACDQAR
jgi:hypothetical protein